ncbi:Ribosomal L39 protein [uncultured archaeon]|nr:Ribosomal L39 protein [uncultured archaeon]
MGKKGIKKKLMLGKKLKQNRRSLPILAQLRTHRKKTFNKFAREWRHRKLKIEVEE